MPIPFDDCDDYPCDYQKNPNPSHINFWFYLFWYFGIYNAIALFLITKMFSIYAFNWYIKSMGPLWTFILFWMTGQGIGTISYFIGAVRNLSVFWIGLTFFTQALPLVTAFWVIRQKKRHRKLRYRIATEAASRTMLYARSLPVRPRESKLPASYKRFLWFCVALSIALVAVVAGECYAFLFLRFRPSRPGEVFVYVYGWIGAIYGMDGLSEWILYRKIRSEPLWSIFKLYFFMVYFIFYRNLFARLRSVDQFAVVQLGSFLWVCLYYPLIATEGCYRLLRYTGLTLTYAEYKQKVARSFYLRHLAENTSMLGFLCWFNWLHFGPNRAAYPYFYRDNQDGNPFDHGRTCVAAGVIWSSELASSFIARRTFKQRLDHSVTQQAMDEFRQYPEMMVGFILVMVHVLQNILFALIRADFLL